MYNGIGLTTPRGSGTNGHVQRNWALVKPKDKPKHYTTEEELAKLDVASNRAPNAEILDHERKRKIELKCAEFAELLEEQGFSEQTITNKVNNYRALLMGTNNQGDKRVDEWGRVSTTETHQMAEAQIEKNARLREAFGISEYYVDGSSFDATREAKEKINKSNNIVEKNIKETLAVVNSLREKHDMQTEESKNIETQLALPHTSYSRYDIVHTPSPEPERPISPKKVKKKKKKKRFEENSSSPERTTTKREKGSRKRSKERSNNKTKSGKNKPKDRSSPRKTSSSDDDYDGKAKSLRNNEKKRKYNHRHQEHSRESSPKRPTSQKRYNEDYTEYGRNKSIRNNKRESSNRKPVIIDESYSKTPSPPRNSINGEYRRKRSRQHEHSRDSSNEVKNHHSRSKSKRYSFSRSSRSLNRKDTHNRVISPDEMQIMPDAIDKFLECRRRSVERRQKTYANHQSNNRVSNSPPKISNTSIISDINEDGARTPPPRSDIAKNNPKHSINHHITPICVAESMEEETISSTAAQVESIGEDADPECEIKEVQMLQLLQNSLAAKAKEAILRKKPVVMPTLDTSIVRACDVFDIASKDDAIANASISDSITNGGCINSNRDIDKKLPTIETSSDIVQSIGKQSVDDETLSLSLHLNREKSRKSYSSGSRSSSSDSQSSKSTYSKSGSSRSPSTYSSDSDSHSRSALSSSRHSSSSSSSSSRSRSPSIPRRRGSPSFLDRRRITRRKRS